MRLPGEVNYLFAVERLDTWVLIVSLAVPVVTIVGLVLLHLLGRLARKFKRQRKAIRESPEPPAPRAGSVRTEAGDDLERLQRACAAMEESLADMYLELGECWLRKGQLSEAISCFQKLVRSLPELPQAAVAQERLGAIGPTAETIKPAVGSKPL